MSRKSRGEGPKCGMSNLSDRRRVKLESGDRISWWAAAVVEDQLCATCRWRLLLTRDFNSSLSQTASSLQVVVICASHPSHYTSRALSRRKLVSRYECGRIFPAGVGPGSPLRDTANWLPSRLILSVETRWRYGWLRMVFPGARFFRAPTLCPSGGVTAREGQGILSLRAW